MKNNNILLILYGIAILLLVIVFVKCENHDDSYEKYEKKKTNIYNKYINKPIPYTEFGIILDEGGDMDYFIGYSDKTFLYFVSRKIDDTILFISTNKQDVDKFFNNIKEIRKKELEEHFSTWDGSHKKLTKLIKISMNDPDSYEHIQTIYWDMTTYIIVQTSFRGKNKFGGIVKNYVKASFDNDGNLIEIIEQG